MGAGIIDAITEDPLITGAVLAVLTVIVWSLFVIRRMARDDMSARHRIAELETDIATAGLHVTVDLASASTRGDGVLLEHLAANLIGNAVKFSQPAAGPIRPVSRRRGGSPTAAR